MIRVVVMLAAKPGRRDELIAAFEDVAQTVRREAGASNMRLSSTRLASALSKRKSGRTAASSLKSGRARRR